MTRITDTAAITRQVMVWISGAFLFLASLTWAQSPASVSSSPIPEKYQLLPLGEVMPEGWLKRQIQENLDGFTGHLDSLAPDLIINDDIYGKNRLSKKVKSKDVGAVGVEGDWQVQFLWWNSETQSNWLDGYIRSAILAGDKKHLVRIEKDVERLLATQDADGYLGIYDRELRYHFDNENGELWAKATLLRGLLAWYDYTKDSRVLRAIERATQNIMDNYPAYRSSPFYSTNPNVGGVTHGITITDVFESLYRLTGKTAYRDYCVFLYDDFSQQVLNEDGQYKKLINDTLPLFGHSVHTYEQLRSLAAAWQASGKQKLGEALVSFVRKIEGVTLPSGAAVGDEWIGGRKADATSRGYEYCGLHELMHSYLELMVKTGDALYAARAERIFLNAAQGARYPGGRAITYLKTDNSYVLAGGLNGDTSDRHQTRYRYSPVHREAAVCCVPNAGRIAPYYVQYMWLKDGQSLVYALPGPGQVRTKVNGKLVTVKVDTDYPHDYRFTFTVSAPKQYFALKIRKPAGVVNFVLNQPYTEENGYIVIRRVWESETITLAYTPEVEKKVGENGEVYFTYGGVVLALPIAATETKTKAYAVKGFYDFSHTPIQRVVYEYAGEPVSLTGPGLQFTTWLLNPATRQKERVNLIPMGDTLLRQVTFKDTTGK